MGNQGEFPLIKAEDRKEATDFYFIQEEDPEKVLSSLITLCSERIPKRFGFHPVRDIQVLAPMHRGTIGVGNLNLELQKTLNPDPAGIIHGSRTFKLGDKVMQITNNYDKDFFNGDNPCCPEKTGLPDRQKGRNNIEATQMYQLHAEATWLHIGRSTPP